MKKRKVQIVVISDVHLGTYGCQAKELNQYLGSIDPDTLILNGDIIDIWQFNKYYWPESHMKVIQQIFQMLANGTSVYYLSGNHDELLRRFGSMKIGNLKFANKLKFLVDNKSVWVFHGDIFDVTMKHSKVLAKFGAIGYDTLILLNSGVNWISEKMGRGRLSLSKKIKGSVKSAVKFISNFEQTATDIAIDNGIDFVICGHIHQPCIRKYNNEKGSVTYLNSGDWVENLTSLEYHNGEWRVFSYMEHYHQELNQNVLNPELKVAEEMPLAS